MDHIHRLFDLLEKYVNNHPNKGMLYSKEGSQWKSYTAVECKELVYKMAASFLRLGISGNDLTSESQGKIAIISNNRPEWILSDFATQITGAVLVPIYPSITHAEWEYILNEAQVSILFVSDKSIYKKLSLIKDNVPSLKHIYSFDQIEGVAHWSELLLDVTVSEIDTIEKIKGTLKPEHLATIIYTSGTTGNPKGVMLSHNNIISNVKSCMECFNFCGSDESALSFLPLNHIFERTVMYIYICKGIAVYFAEGMEMIGPNLREVKPVVFTTVPRLLEKVFEKIDATGRELTGFKRSIFDWSVQLAMKYEIGTPKSLPYKMQLALADFLVYKKWRNAVGGKIKAIVTGSAACQVKLLRLFTAAKIIVMEGYGLTETSPVISVNRFQEENRRFGTVGTIIKDVEVQLAEDGEIVCKGPNIMMGYYKHPELTAEVIKDGWFYTGDIGQIVDNKFLKITDRKKEIFKISGGKYIAPLPIENKMKESSFIEQIMVVGSNEKFAGALIVPAKEKIKDYFLKLGVPLDSSVDITTDKDVQKLIRKELDRYNIQFAPHEQVKKFQMVNAEWTIDTGELTATMKLKRRKIMEKFGHLVEKIYT
ncbi:MAG: long-chain fatty acid--CoA ligase [Bacteroidetes bacterium]|nr:long-chain fatty acid--CoA ligase [Bacteroidota bacterium]MBP6315158.1 long-chain fatty acid--CoA ligase [Chitinophagaceae bacterium]